jgi:hypothetical protein
VLLVLIALAALCGCRSEPAAEPSEATLPSPVAAETTGEPAASQQEPVTTAQPELAPEPLPLDADERDAGWIRLFDGATLYGWQPAGKANWQVHEGAITVSEGEVGLLCTTTRFADYELKLQFKADKGTNSGIFLRTPLKPGDPSVDCYELNIAPPDNPFPTGSLVARSKHELESELTGWQQFHVTVSQGAITVLLNGEKVIQYQDPSPLLSGFIGLQLNQGAVAFREIKLKPLGMTSLFNGTDLSGWKTDQQMASRFRVTEEGWLNVKNGRGQLESEQLFGDFLLQLECITHAPDLNSGIFFRCIPGEQMNGYECQIHNGFQQGDPTRPKDCGSGGIFRRQDARRVVARDQQWFPMTIVAEGPRITTWVNGYQVTDWTDTRAADPNPRRGLRTEPGSIMIQGHDPTTNISFRKLRIWVAGDSGS